MRGWQRSWCGVVIYITAGENNLLVGIHRAYRANPTQGQHMKLDRRQFKVGDAWIGEAVASPSLSTQSGKIFRKIVLGKSAPLTDAAD